jgi:hypothetical protein
MHSARTLKVLLALLATTGLALALVISADARVPKFKPKTIVPGKSIGGVKVGMTKAQAVAVWGKPDRCQVEQTATWCQYIAPSTLADGTVTPPQPYAGFYLRSRKVIEVTVETAENTAVDPKLNRLKTKKKIKLGSTMDKARAAYNLPPPSGGEAGRSRALLKQGKRCTMFYAPTSPYVKIEAITVGLCNANVGLLIGVR